MLQVRGNQILVTTSEASLFVFRVDVPRDHFTTSHLKFALPKDSSIVKASDKYLLQLSKTYEGETMVALVSPLAVKGSNLKCETYPKPN